MEKEQTEIWHSPRKMKNVGSQVGANFVSDEITFTRRSCWVQLCVEWADWNWKNWVKQTVDWDHKRLKAATTRSRVPSWSLVLLINDRIHELEVVGLFGESLVCFFFSRNQNSQQEDEKNIGIIDVILSVMVIIGELVLRSRTLNNNFSWKKKVKKCEIEILSTFLTMFAYEIHSWKNLSYFSCWFLYVT